MNKQKESKESIVGLIRHFLNNASRNPIDIAKYPLMHLPYYYEWYFRI